MLSSFSQLVCTSLYVHVQNYGVHYIESHMTRRVTNSAESAEKNRDSAWLYEVSTYVSS